MTKTELEKVAATIDKLATPNMKSKDLMKAVKAAHPDVSSKTITRAALHAKIQNCEADGNKAQRLQDFSITQRTVD